MYHWNISDTMKNQILASVFLLVIFVVDRTECQIFGCIYTNASGLTEQCRQDYNYACEASGSSDPKDDWAEIMFISSGKLESGTSYGNLNFEGDYRECTRFPAEDGIEIPLEGGLHYCMAFWGFFQGHGVCLPARCTEEDFLIILKKGYGRPTLGADIWLHYCVEEKQMKGDIAAIMTIVILGIFVVIVLAATLYEFAKKRRKPSTVIPTEAYSHKDKSAVHQPPGDITQQNGLLLNEATGTATIIHVPDATNIALNGTIQNPGVADGKFMGPGDTSNSEAAGMNPRQLTAAAANGSVIQPDESAAFTKHETVFNGTTETMIPVGESTRFRKGLNLEKNGIEAQPVKVYHSTADQGKTMMNKTPGSTIKNKLEASLLSFSLVCNVPKLVNAKHPKGSYECLNGIRFLSMAWIVLGHTYSLGTLISEMRTVANYVQLWYWQESFWYHAINEMHLAVESFFVLSAMLVTISFLKQMRPPTNLVGSTLPMVLHYTKKMSLYYFHRYWRLTAVYAIIVMIYANLYHYFATGPFFPPYVHDSDQCKDWWWKNLLYLSNLVHPEIECMGWTWYLTCDFQYYVILPVFVAPLVLYEYLAKKKGQTACNNVLLGLSFVWIGLAFSGSMVSRYYLYHELYSGNEDISFYPDIYYTPWCRSAVYFMGICLGYIIYKTNRRIKMHKIVVFLGWLVGISSIVLPVYLRYLESPDCTGPGCTGTWSLWGSVGFSAWQRPWFALGIIWITFACLTGYGGIVNTILSWNFWVPLGRLTYVGYLVHPILCYFYAYSSPVQLYISEWMMVYLFFGHLSITLGISFVICLVFEIPLLALEKVFLPH